MGIRGLLAAPPVLVLKNLLRRRIRTLLSILGVSIGIAAIIAFNAVGQGFRSSIERYMRESGRLSVFPGFDRS